MGGSGETLQSTLMWVVPAAVWLVLWPPSSLAPRWLVRVAIAASLAIWVPLRGLAPLWLPPWLWFALSLCEIANKPQNAWIRALVPAFVAVAVMLEWPAFAPFTTWWGAPPDVWAALIVGAAVSAVSPRPDTRALASAGWVAAGWALGRDGLALASIFVFAAAFEVWRAIERAIAWRRSGERAGH